jgi:hypothetical protein
MPLEYERRRSGAWQPGFAADNLKITLADKEPKLQKYKHLYKESWLALLDCIGYGINDYYMEELRTYMGLESEFDKILIFSPFHHFQFNTLYTKTNNLLLLNFTELKVYTHQSIGLCGFASRPRKDQDSL